MTDSVIVALVLTAGNFLVGVTAMYAVYLVQERSLVLGYFLAGLLAVTITYAEMALLGRGRVAFVVAVAGLAGVAFVAWGWKPVFNSERRGLGSSRGKTDA